MLLYEDIITGDEMFSDAFPLWVAEDLNADFGPSYPRKEVDEVAYEVDCAMVTFKEGDVDIGANPSTEEQEEGVDDTAQTVNNVVHSFRLQPTTFDKKSYLGYLKGYMKAIKAKLQENGCSEADVKAFETKAGAFAKKVVGNFKDFEFYTGESMNPEGMVALLNYREDGVTPYFTFWKDGLKQVKL
ncbi:hypothetical protein FRC17_007597 [Serendipita sp. 399]|nr:hypothetical protein FRC17_007597 [Serendipita sp. 399]